MAEQQDWFSQNAPTQAQGGDWFSQNAPGATGGTDDKTKDSPGFFKRLAQGLNLPSSVDELKAASQPSTAETIGGPAVTAGKMAYSYGKNLWDQAKKSGGEIFNAGKTAGETGQYLPAAGSAGLSALEFLNRGVLAPVGGNAIQNTAEDVNDPTKSKAAVGGDVTAALLSAAMLRSPKAGTPEGGPGAFKSFARNLVSANDNKVVGAVSDIADKAAKAQDATRLANQGATESTLADRGSVDNRNASQMKDHVAETQKVNEANQALLDQHATDTAAVRQQNLEHVRSHSQRLAEENELNDVSQQLQEAHDTAKSEGAAANSDQWAKVRTKMGGGDLPIDPTQAHQALTDARATITNPDEAKEFDQVVQSSLSPEELAEDQSLGANYDALSPEYQAHVDKMTSEALPALEGIAKDGSEPMTFNKLHGIYSELGTKLSRGNLGGQTYFGLKKLRESIGGMMETEAQKKGALGDLQAARKGHAQYSKTFRDSPYEKQTEGTKSLKELTPDYIAQQAQNRRITNIGRYNPEYPNLARRALELQDSIKKLPDADRLQKLVKPEPTPPTLKPLPEAPTPYEYKEPNATKPIEVPEVSTQQTREDLIHKTAARWRETSQYQIRRLAASGIAGIIASVTGHGEAAGLVGSGYLLAEMAPKVAAAIIEKPKVIKWLTAPSIGDINALKTVPNIDRIRIIDRITDIALEEANAGRPFQVGKDAIHLLGPGRIALIANAMAHPVPQDQTVVPADKSKGIQEVKLPVNAADAKDRIKQLQGEGR